MILNIIIINDWSSVNDRNEKEVMENENNLFRINSTDDEKCRITILPGIS